MQEAIHLRFRHFLGGAGSKMDKICQQILVKNCWRGQKLWKFADVLNGWSLMLIPSLILPYVVVRIKSTTDSLYSSYKLPAYARICSCPWLVYHYICLQHLSQELLRIFFIQTYSRKPVSQCVELKLRWRFCVFTSTCPEIYF